MRIITRRGEGGWMENRALIASIIKGPIIIIITGSRKIRFVIRRSEMILLYPTDLYRFVNAIVCEIPRDEWLYNAWLNWWTRERTVIGVQKLIETGRRNFARNWWTRRGSTGCAKHGKKEEKLGQTCFEYAIGEYRVYESLCSLNFRINRSKLEWIWKRFFRRGEKNAKRLQGLTELTGNQHRWGRWSNNNVTKNKRERKARSDLLSVIETGRGRGTNEGRRWSAGGIDFTRLGAPSLRNLRIRCFNCNRCDQTLGLRVVQVSTARKRALQLHETPPFPSPPC